MLACVRYDLQLLYTDCFLTLKVRTNDTPVYLELGKNASAGMYVVTECCSTAKTMNRLNDQPNVKLPRLKSRCLVASRVK